MSLESVKDRIASIKRNLDELSIIKEVYEAEQKLREIEQKIKRTKEEIEGINEDISISRPLLNSLKSEEKDLKIYENKYKNLVDYWEKKRRQEELISGNLTGANAIKAQRELALENQKEVDNQGLIIDSIGENIKNANVNLVNINNELQNQGEQMNRIQEKTLETENQVKQTGKIMTRMEGRAKCIQILTFLAVFIFGLFDVVLVTFLLIRKFV